MRNVILSINTMTTNNTNTSTSGGAAPVDQ
jgi:hypothetical protein